MTGVRRTWQGRRAEEARAQSLSAELSSVRHEMEKRLAAKEEELESVRSVSRAVTSRAGELGKRGMTRSEDENNMLN